MLFSRIVACAPPEQFVQSDEVQLISYVQSTLLVQALFDACCDDATKVRDYTAAVKVQAALARQLRLTPHGRLDPRTLARKVEIERNRGDRARLPRAGE